MITSNPFFFPNPNIMNNAAWTFAIQVFVWKLAFGDFGYIPRNRIARSYGNSKFKFLRNRWAVAPVAVPFYVPASNVWEFPFLCVCANTRDFPFFPAFYGSPSGFEMLSQVILKKKKLWLKTYMEVLLFSPLPFLLSVLRIYKLIQIGGIHLTSTMCWEQCWALHLYYFIYGV